MMSFLAGPAKLWDISMLYLRWKGLILSNPWSLNHEYRSLGKPFEEMGEIKQGIQKSYLAK